MPIDLRFTFATLIVCQPHDQSAIQITRFEKPFPDTHHVTSFVNRLRELTIQSTSSREKRNIAFWWVFSAIWHVMSNSGLSARKSPNMSS